MHRFDTFVEARRGDLRRIAYATQGKMEADDLIQEAWVVAIEIGDGMEEPFDFSNLEHQEHLIAKMYVRFVKYADKTVRYAMKLDPGWDQLKKSPRAVPSPKSSRGRNPTTPWWGGTGPPHEG